MFVAIRFRYVIVRFVLIHKDPILSKLKRNNKLFIVGTSTDVSRYAGIYEEILENTTAGVSIQAPQV